MAWQDDMFLQVRWLVAELTTIFDRHREVGLLGLSRGLDMFPVGDPIERWEDLQDWRRLQSTIGSFPWNWLRIQEVDSTIRPWIIRRACLERVGLLDEAFVPTEWDEADLAVSRTAQRAGKSRHAATSASAPISILAAARSEHYPTPTRRGSSRTDDCSMRDGIRKSRRSHARTRTTWLRPMSIDAWATTGFQALRAVPRRLADRRS